MNIVVLKTKNQCMKQYVGSAVRLRKKMKKCDNCRCMTNKIFSYYKFELCKSCNSKKIKIEKCLYCKESFVKTTLSKIYCGNDCQRNHYRLRIVRNNEYISEDDKKLLIKHNMIVDREQQR